MFVFTVSTSKTSQLYFNAETQLVADIGSAQFFSTRGDARNWYQWNMRDIVRIMDVHALPVSELRLIEI